MKLKTEEQQGKIYETIARNVKEFFGKKENYIGQKHCIKKRRALEKGLMGKKEKKRD